MKFNILLCFVCLAVGYVAGQSSSICTSLQSPNVPACKPGFDAIFNYTTNIYDFNCQIILINGMINTTNNADVSPMLTPIVKLIIDLNYGLIKKVCDFIDALRNTIPNTFPTDFRQILKIQCLMDMVCTFTQSILTTSLSAAEVTRRCNIINCLVKMTFDLIDAIATILVGLFNPAIFAGTCITGIPNDTLQTILNNLAASVQTFFLCIRLKTSPFNCTNVCLTMKDRLTCTVNVLRPRNPPNLNVLQAFANAPC